MVTKVKGASSHILNKTTAPNTDAEFIGQTWVNTSTDSSWVATTVGTGASDWISVTDGSNGVANLLELQALEEEATLRSSFIGGKYRTWGGISAGETADTFGGQYTFTRSSDATGYGTSTLDTVTTDQPRFVYDPDTKARKGLLIEESRTNLFEYSEDFGNGAWGGAGRDVFPDSFLAPTGKLRADKIVEDTANSLHFIRQNVNMTSGLDYTLTVYGRTEDARLLELVMFDSSINAIFDLSGAGSVVSVSSDETASIEKAGDFYRCRLTFTSFSTLSSFCDVRINKNGTPTDSYAGDGISGLIIFGAMVEQGSFPTSYTASTDSFTSRSTTATFYDSDGVLQTAAIDVARDDAYGYLDGVLYPIGLLLEESRENLLINSDAPVTQTVTVTDATEYTLSVWGSGSAEITVGGSGTATLGNTLTFTSSGTSVEVTVTGSLDYFQLEEGAYGTSPIVTAGTSVTRAADVSSSAQTTRAADDCVRTLGAEFNEGEFTLYFKFNPAARQPSSSTQFFSLTDGTSANRLELATFADNFRLVVNDDGGATQVDDFAAYTGDGVTASFAIAVTSGQIQGGALDGQFFANSFTINVLASDFIRLMGRFDGNASIANGTAEDFRIFPRALTQTELEVLTS